MTEKVKLSSLEDDTPVKLNLELPASVHRDLVAYGEAMTSSGHRPIEPAKLAGAMLARFMSTDRAFAKLRRAKP